MSYIDELAREARAQERELRDPILGDCGLCGGKHLMDRRSRTFISTCKASLVISALEILEMEGEMGATFERCRR